MNTSEAIAFFEEVDTAVTGAARIGQPMNLPTHFFAIQGMYTRSISLYRGVVQLLKVALPEEGLLLGRSLFEDSLRLSHLAASDEGKRVDLTMGWLNESYLRHIGLVRRAKNLGIGWDWEPYLSKLEETRKQALAYCRRRGSGKTAQFPDPKRQAESLGRTGGVWLWEASHQVVHGNEYAHLLRRESIGDAMAFRLGNNNFTSIASVGTFAAESLLASHKAVCRLFDWDFTEPMQELSNRVDELDRELTRLAREQDGPAPTET